MPSRVVRVLTLCAAGLAASGCIIISDGKSGGTYSDGADERAWRGAVAYPLQTEMRAGLGPARMDAHPLLEGHLAAYLAADWEAFAAVYAPDARYVTHTGQVFLDGRDAIREHFATQRAETPAVTADIVARYGMGPRRAVEHELWYANGRTSAPVELFVVYDFAADGPIQTVTIIQGPRPA